MSAVDWLVSFRLESLIHREHDWVFRFNNDANLVAGCLWRLLENQHIRCTSADDGHKFGLPAPVDAAREINDRIAGTHIESVNVRPDTLDLTLGFTTGHVIEIIPDSSGYEAWQLCHKTAQVIAVGGGELAVFGNIQENA